MMIDFSFISISFPNGFYIDYEVITYTRLRLWLLEFFGNDSMFHITLL